MQSCNDTVLFWFSLLKVFSDNCSTIRLKCELSLMKVAGPLLASPVVPRQSHPALQVRIHLPLPQTSNGVPLILARHQAAFGSWWREER